MNKEVFAPMDENIKLQSQLKEVEANKPKEVVMTCDHFSMYGSDFKKVVMAFSKLRNDKIYTRHINTSDIDKVSGFIDELVLSREKKGG